jgi:acetylornithine deacetylase/succinyl-diaminopimelate desuccinylase-like protein
VGDALASSGAWRWRLSSTPIFRALARGVINTTFVQAGTYVGSVPGYARIDGNISYPSWLDADTVRAEFEQVIQLHAQLNDWLRENPPKVTIGQVYDWPPHVCPDTPALDMLARAVEQVGHKPIFSGTKFVADAAFLQRECDMYRRSTLAPVTARWVFTAPTNTSRWRR